MPKSSIRPASPITAAVADPTDAWAAAMTPVFVPDVLDPLEMTAQMYADHMAKRGEPLTVTHAMNLLRRGWAEGRLTRRKVKLIPAHKGEYAYRPR